MLLLVSGLVLFLGTHSVRIVADGWRTRMVERMGLGAWKGIYTLVALAGLVLIATGYGQARAAAPDLWVTPVWLKHLAGLLTLPAFVLLAASQVPRTRIKARLRHPMLMGVKAWAFAHLLANGRLADLILFGAILVWAILDGRSARLRDERSGKAYPEGTAGRDATAVVAGVVAWGAFAFFLHGWLIGVSPYPL